MAIGAAQPSHAACPVPQSILRWISIVFLALIVLVVLAVLIIWLIIKPKHLVYTIEEGSIHNFNLSPNHLNATFDFIIRSYNPNTRFSIYYDSVEVSVDYDDQTLAYTMVQPFLQSHRNVNRLVTKLTMQSLSMFGDVYKDIRLDKSKGEIAVSVLLKTRIRFKVRAWKSHHRTLNVLCSPVLVHFSRSKTFERKYCDVEL